MVAASSSFAEGSDWARFCLLARSHPRDYRATGFTWRCPGRAVVQGYHVLTASGAPTATAVVGWRTATHWR